MLADTKWNPNEHAASWPEHAAIRSNTPYHVPGTLKIRPNTLCSARNTARHGPSTPCHARNTLKIGLNTLKSRRARCVRGRHRAFLPEEPPCNRRNTACPGGFQRVTAEHTPCAQLSHAVIGRGTACSWRDTACSGRNTECSPDSHSKRKSSTRRAGGRDRRRRRGNLRSWTLSSGPRCERRAWIFHGRLTAGPSGYRLSDVPNDRCCTRRSLGTTKFGEIPPSCGRRRQTRGSLHYQATFWELSGAPPAAFGARGVQLGISSTGPDGVWPSTSS
jgi:hypothetical protein